jgi:dGTPase
MSDDKAFSQRRKPLSMREKTDLRPPFAIDCDRILYSLAYTRYIDKTQVFYLLQNDHVSHRVLHVQLVSRIGRTIGQKLGLNLDLIEAAALGHDLGHAPFGHDGEYYLSKLCKAHNIGGISGFSHPLMSLRFLDRLEKHGLGLNLTLGVLDAILCHDGESDLISISPGGEASFEELDRRIDIKTRDPKAFVPPMTPEGCVVRLADSISYVGRDLEDAVRLRVIKRSSLPKMVTETLGSTNGTIVYKLVEDLLNTSSRKKNVYGFSKKVGAALIMLKDFSRVNIYLNPKVKEEAAKIQHLYYFLFETVTNEFKRKKGPRIKQLKHFVDQMDESYVLETSPAEMARDFIAGMTDEFFLTMAKEVLLPSKKHIF